MNKETNISGSPTRNKAVLGDSGREYTMSDGAVKEAAEMRCVQNPSNRVAPVGAGTHLQALKRRAESLEPLLFWVLWLLWMVLALRSVPA